MSFMAAALPALIGGALSAFGPGAGTARKAQKLQNQVIQNQMGVMKQLRGYANGVPGSDPMEAAQFANSRAQLGQQQNGQRDQMNAMFNRNQGMGNLGDMQANMNSNFQAQQMRLNAEQMLGAMQNRRSALLQSAQVGQTVPNLAVPSNGLPEVFGSLAQTWAHQQALNQQNKGQDAQAALMRSLIGGAGSNVPLGPGVPPGMPGVEGSAQPLPSMAPGGGGFNPALSLNWQPRPWDHYGR